MNKLGIIHHSVRDRMHHLTLWVRMDRVRSFPAFRHANDGARMHGGVALRFFGMVMIAMASAPLSFAQPDATDGQARLAGPAAAFFTPENVAAPASKEQMRATITALMENGRIDAGELDFLREVAAQTPFLLTIPATPGGLSVPPASDDAAALARLLISPPNMHTLWHGDAQKTGQLVEISRWGPLARQRVANFFGSKLYDAWGQSNLLNAFSPFVDSLGREWNAVKALNDPAAVRAGKELLIDGCAIAKQKVVDDGKPPLEGFLCAWMPNSL